MSERKTITKRVEEETKEWTVVRQSVTSNFGSQGSPRSGTFAQKTSKPLEIGEQKGHVILEPEVYRCSLQGQSPNFEKWKSEEFSNKIQQDKAYLWAFGDNRKKALSVRKNAQNVDGFVRWPMRVAADHFPTRCPQSGEVQTP
jgi:hypothetical protein